MKRGGSAVSSVPEGRRLEFYSSGHVGVLGKSFTRSFL